MALEKPGLDFEANFDVMTMKYQKNVYFFKYFLKDHNLFA